MLEMLLFEEAKLFLHSLGNAKFLRWGFKPEEYNYVQHDERDINNIAKYNTSQKSFYPPPPCIYSYNLDNNERHFCHIYLG